MSPIEAARNGWEKRQLLSQEHFVHAIVVVVVVVCVTFLGSRDQIDHNTVGFVYATAIGYAAGRSGTRSSQSTRKEDPDG